jgi:predicted DNA-binding mobile mystery protein A
MSQADLAARLGVRQTTVLSMEASEVDGRIQLNTLTRAAEALDCDLVYALVPRRGLQDMLDQRIRAHARAQLAAVNQTMLLENQLPADDEQRLNAIIETITAHPAGIWKPPGPPSGPEAGHAARAGDPGGVPRSGDSHG